MTAYLIGLDVGSSALKAVLASADAGVVAIAERAYPMHRPHPGWAENDAEDWVAAAAAAVPEVLCQAGLDADDVTGVCIVGQRDIVVLIDAPVRCSGDPFIGPIVVTRTACSGCLIGSVATACSGSAEPRPHPGSCCRTSSGPPPINRNSSPARPPRSVPRTT